MKTKLMKIILTVMLLLTAIAVEAQTDGRIIMEREFDFNKDGFIYQISGSDTLRCITAEIFIPENYYLYKASISSSPILNIYCKGGNIPLYLSADSTSPNNLYQIYSYDTTNWHTLLEISSFQNIVGDSVNYNKVYTSYYFQNSIDIDYIYFWAVNVHTQFLNLNKMHVIFYFKRFI